MEFTMSDAPRLSVREALEKLRCTEALKSRMAQLDDELDELEAETMRLREQRLLLERHQRRFAGLD
jgi:hypothetical protein